MSALGEYVHLNKFNYFKYGIAYKTLRNEGGYTPLIQQWVKLHDEIAAKITSDVNMGPIFELEKRLNSQMENLRAYMKALSEEPENSVNKQALYQELFSGALAKAQDLVNVNIATGKVTAKVGTTSVEGDQLDFIKRWDNLTGFVKVNDILDQEQIDSGKIDVVAIIQKTLNLSREFFESIKLTMNDKDLKKNEKKYKQIETFLKRAESIVANAVSKRFAEVLDFEQVKTQVKGLSNFKTKYQGSKWIKIDDTLIDAAVELVAARKLMKVPNTSLIQGKLMEILTRDFLKTVDSIGIMTVSNKIGDIVREGEGKKVISKYVAKHVTTFTEAHSSLQIDEVESPESDKITELKLDYKYDSQRKADVRFKWAVQEGFEQKIAYSGINIKNYMVHNITVVDKSPLITFLFNNPFFDEDRINHLLNSITDANTTTDEEKKEAKKAGEPESKKQDDKLTGVINSLKLEANLALRLNILWSAISGENLGKGPDNNAQFFLLNVPYLELPMIVSVKRLVKTILSNKNLNELVSVFDDLKRDLGAGDFSLKNTMVAAKTKGSKATFAAAHERIGSIINELHARKISATIPQQAVLAASHALKYI